MTDPSVCTAVDCHYLRDSAEICAKRGCPFADRREEAPEDPEPEDDGGVVVWRMRDDHPQGANRGARGLERADRARREAGGAA